MTTESYVEKPKTLSELREGIASGQPEGYRSCRQLLRAHRAGESAPECLPEPHKGTRTRAGSQGGCEQPRRAIPSAHLPAFPSVSKTCSSCAAHLRPRARRFSRAIIRRTMPLVYHGLRLPEPCCSANSIATSLRWVPPTRTRPMAPCAIPSILSAFPADPAAVLLQRLPPIWPSRRLVRIPAALSASPRASAEWSAFCPPTAVSPVTDSSPLLLLSIVSAPSRATSAMPPRC